MVENECLCSKGKAYYYPLEKYLADIYMTYDKSINIEGKIFKEKALLSLKDFTVYFRNYLDNNSDIHNNILQQANKLDLFYYQQIINDLQHSYALNRRVNEALIHLVIILYNTYNNIKTHITYDNINYATRSLSSINTNLKQSISISDNIHDSISNCLNYFNTQYIIKASSLPLEFNLQKQMKGHSSPAYSLLELSNGFLLSGADDHKLKIWDLNTYQNTTTLIGHTGSVFGIQEMRDGKLASCSEDRTVIIWSKFPYKYESTLKGHNDNVNSIIQIKDGRLVTGSDDATIIIWSIKPKDNNTLSSLTTNSGPVSLVIELFDGRVLGLHINGKITIWNIVSLTLVGVLGDIESGLWFALQLKNSNLIAFFDNQPIQMWNINTLQLIKTIANSQTEVFSLFEMEDGVIGSASPNSMAIFDSIEDKCIRSYEGIIKEATFLVRLLDGRIVYSSSDNSLYILL